jgi:hypothetical protein
LSKEEKQFLNDLILKMTKEAQNSEQVLHAIQNKLLNEAVNIGNKIQTELISRLQSPSEICSFFSDLGLRSSNSEEKRICQTLTTPLSPVPPLVIPPLELPPLPSLPPRPDGQCRAQLPIPPCRVVRVPFVCQHCEKVRFVGRVCHPIPCTGGDDQEIPSHCREAQRITQESNEQYRSICAQIRNWEREVNRIRGIYDGEVNQAQRQYEDKRRRLTEENDRLKTELIKQVSQQATSLARLHALANNAVDKYLLRKVDTQAVARKLLNAAWQAEEFIDLTKDFLTDRVPQDLTFTVKGSAKVAFHSEAHLLHATPKLKTASVFNIAQNERAAFKIDVSGFEDTRQENELSGIGGLDVLG